MKGLDMPHRAPTAARPARETPRTAREVEEYETGAALDVLRAMLIQGKRHHRR